MNEALQTKLHMLALRDAEMADQFVPRTSSVRFIFEAKSKPWYWRLIWWLQKWKNYGDFIMIAPDDPRYEAAPYEMGILYSVGINPKSTMPIIHQKPKE